MAGAEQSELPREFFSRRMHSAMGLWFVLFLCEHLLVNSQAALWLGDDGHGFVEMVNKIHNLPYLPAIELLLLGMPILYHIVFGVKYLLDAKPNVVGKGGKTPALGQYARNHRYTWQRITSWILLFCVIWHVYDMRFCRYPDHAGDSYFVTVTRDGGLNSLSARLDSTVYGAAEVKKAAQEALTFRSEKLSVLSREGKSAEYYALEKKEREAQALSEVVLEGNQVAIVAADFGTATLFTVRDTFKDPWMVGLYTIFVLSACYHGFNGLWSFCITWGIALTSRAQALLTRVSVGLFLLFGFFGLASVWLTYAVNLYN